MKNLILVLVLGLTMMLSMPTSAQESNQELSNVEQTQPPPQKQGFFQKIKDSVTDSALGIGVAFVFGLFVKKGWSLAIKNFANYGGTVTKEIGETFIGGSRFFNVLEQSIKDDGSLKENTLKELLVAGKEVVAEAADVIISIKPKPVR